MIINRVTDPKTGKARLHSYEPFTAETPEEEMLLHYLVVMSRSLEEIEGATLGETDNPIVVKLYEMETTLTAGLQAIVDELRLMRAGGVQP